MSRRIHRPLFILPLALALLLLALAFLGRPDRQVQSNLVSAAGPASNLADPSGFARAEAPQPLSFPADHGPHPDYQTEWWYYTGNLRTASGRRFGYQFTIFRRALLPEEKRTLRGSAWAADHIYMAHFAITDVGGQQHHAFERLARGAAGLAGAQAGHYRVWLENWSVEEVGDNRYRLQAAQEGLALDLVLIDQKGPILQGDQGYSRKGPEPGNASFYYSLTRLNTEGIVQVGQERFQVDGLSWMDHEYSTSALSSGQVGWDWFSIQLEGGSEIMVFQIRREDGSIDPFSSGTFIKPDGSTVPLGKEDFEINVQETWHSPYSAAEYPSRWEVRVPSLDLSLEITPHLADQELNLSYSYWEGAVRVDGQHAGRPVSGNGYVELTGYTRSMTGEF